MNMANVSGVAPNPNPSSGERFPSGAPSGGSVSGSFMQGGGDNNMPSAACFGNNAGAGGNLPAMYERLASASGGAGGGFEDYDYGPQGSNNLARAAAGACFPNLSGSNMLPSSNQGAAALGGTPNQGQGSSMGGAMSNVTMQGMVAAMAGSMGGAGPYQMGGQGNFTPGNL